MWCGVFQVNDMGEDLSRMFRLFARVPEGLPPMADIVKLHIADVGNEKTEMRMARAEGKEEKETNDDPQFVKVLPPSALFTRETIPTRKFKAQFVCVCVCVALGLSPHCRGPFFLCRICWQSTTSLSTW